MTGYVTIRKFCELTGYTEDAVNTKIRDGVWMQNRVWRKAPDGRRLISMEGYWAWVEMGVGSEKSLKVPMKSPLPLKGSGAGRGSRSGDSPRAPTDENANKKRKKAEE